MDSRRAVHWPLGRVIAIGALPPLGAAAALGWTHGLYANATLAALLACWAGTTAALAMRREADRLPAAPPPATRETAAEREQRRLTAYLNLSPAPLVTLEQGYRLRAVNRAARRLFGAEDVVPEPDAGLVRAITQTPPGGSATVRLDLGAGAQAYALATADLTGAGPATRIAALVDIDAELRAAEAHALRDLLHVLSHEIMNALTPIASLGRTAVDLLDSADDEDRAAARDAIETVARRAEGLHRFSSAYRELARLPEPRLAPFAITPFVEDIARLFRTRWPDVALRVEIEGRAPLFADADQLNAALWALLQNAAEALAGRPGGEIALTLARAPHATRITIADNGPGIAPADRASIFQPFFTTKASGSGVGLPLARQILLGHQGSITLASEPGAGACFTLTLPQRAGG